MHITKNTAQRNKKLMAAKRKYSFAERNDSSGGKLAVHLGMTALLLLAADVFISVLSEGNAGAYSGAIAICGALFSVYGFYVGMLSFGEKNTSPKYSIIGSILSGVVMIGYLAVLLAGFGS